MLQNPHRSQPRAPCRLQDLGAGLIGAKKLAQRSPSTGTSAKKFAQHRPSTGTSAKNSPSKRKNADFRAFRACRANFFALTHTSGHAGRTFSRTRLDNVATLKPPTPLLAPNKGPLKPTSPLRPKTAPKKPISHPQRRWRFQPTTGTSEQRRQGFQAIGRPGRQGLTTAPAGGGWASPRRPWAISVTNVVKPTRFTSPREDPCYKLRQSKPKNRHYQRKSPRIDDVRNNGAEIHTKNTLN